uniref:G-protein coupled receptors family 1 profile domain-containing protein n=1 Tax=Crocodylus porosus TaxID=8502 RepID=A0A7M4F7I6_CROPO
MTAGCHCRLGPVSALGSSQHSVQAAPGRLGSSRPGSLLSSTCSTAGECGALKNKKSPALTGSCAFCIPMYIPYVLTGKWEFGKGPCKLWLLLDHLMCTASSFNIALISYDQYLSVTKAVSSTFIAVTSLALCSGLIMMGAIRVFAFLIYGPVIIIWEYVAGCSIVPDDECYPEFIYNWYFTLCASVFEDKKAAKSLAIIVYIFAICWAPYSLLMIISAVYRKQCISEPLFEFTSWLLWLNFFVNLFLYPLCHVKFQRAFRKILCLKKPVIFESHQPDSSQGPSNCWRSVNKT